MDPHATSEPAAPKNPTTVARKSDREMEVTRTFDAPARLVFEAWATPALFQRWWAPRSMGVPMRSCTMDVRVGGGYRIEFAQDDGPAMAFFGTYVDVTPPSRLSWTNEESPDGAITTVTFEERDGRTLLVLHELYPSKEALEASLGGLDMAAEQFGQLDELLVAQGLSAAR